MGTLSGTKYVVVSTQCIQDVGTKEVRRLRSFSIRRCSAERGDGVCQHAQTSMSTSDITPVSGKRPETHRGSVQSGERAC